MSDVVADHLTAAWSRYAEALTRRIDELIPGRPSQLDFITPPSEVGAAPCILLHTGGDRSRFCLEVVSNSLFGDTLRLHPSMIAGLLRLGWVPEPSTEEELQIPRYSFIVDAGASSAADHLIRALRYALGVPHPSLVLPPAPEVNGGAPSRPPTDPHDGETPLPVDEASSLETPDDLRRALSQALRNHFGEYRAAEHDGTHVIVSGGAEVLLRVRDEGLIEFFALPLVPGPGTERAAAAIAEINRGSTLAEFQMSDGTVAAHYCLPALPFVPRHLYSVLNMLTTVADAITEIVVSPVLEHPLVNRDDVEGRFDGPLPVELLALVELASGPPAEFAAETTSSLMHDSAHRARDCLQLAEAQRDAWADRARTAEELEVLDEVHTARNAALWWEDATDALTGAIGLLVAGPGADEESAPDG